MSIEERIDQAMRATANSVEPPVTKLVDGGLARGRRKRRNRVAAVTGGILAATAVVAGGAVALPDLMTGSPDVVADAGDEEEAEGVEPQTAPYPTSGRARLVIEDPDPAVSEDQLAALIEDVAALSGGTYEPLPTMQSPMSVIRLDFGDHGVGQVRANSIDDSMASGDPCEGLRECEVLLETDTSVVSHAGTPSGSRLAYLAKSGSGANLSVWAETVSVREGITAGDLGFDNADELRDAILAAVPDAETPGRGEFTAAELDDIAREVAGLSTTTRGEFVQMYGHSRSGRVSFGEAAGFDIRGSHDLEGNDLGVWTESCERGASDGKPCTELLNTGEVGVFASTYPNQGNRESLRYVADMADGSLVIVIDNYMETGSGKVVGSSLADAGIDADELVAVVENTGLLDD